MIDRYENVECKVDGTKLVITCELDPELVDAQPSSSGKSVVYATTGGAKRVDGFAINLTVYKKP